MSKKVLVSIKVDQKLKEEAEAVYSEETIAAVEDVRQNRNLSEAFNSVDKMIEELKVGITKATKWKKTTSTNYK